MENHKLSLVANMTERITSCLGTAPPLARPPNPPPAAHGLVTCRPCCFHQQNTEALLIWTCIDQGVYAICRSAGEIPLHPPSQRTADHLQRARPASEGHTAGPRPGIPLLRRRGSHPTFRSRAGRKMLWAGSIAAIFFLLLMGHLIC